MTPCLPTPLAFTVYSDHPKHKTTANIMWSAVWRSAIQHSILLPVPCHTDCGVYTVSYLVLLSGLKSASRSRPIPETEALKHTLSNNGEGKLRPQESEIKTDRTWVLEILIRSQFNKGLKRSVENFSS
jgi:hypothetical protein